MKKITAALLAALMLVSSVPLVYAEEVTAVYLDGEKQFDVEVIVVNGTVMVPIRPIFELFRFKLEWDELRKRINTTTALGKLIIGIDSVLVSQGDYQAYVLSTPPRLYHDRTYIPIDFAAACTDVNIQYAENIKSLVINSN